MSPQSRNFQFSARGERYVYFKNVSPLGTPLVAASHCRLFEIKVNICSAFFSTRISFEGVLKIYIANKILLTQTEKLEDKLPVLPKKRNQM